MNDMKKTETVEIALERLYEKLDDLNAKQGAMSDGCAELYREILHGIKSGETIAAMKGGDGYSRRDGSYYDGGSYARKRNSMGRYSRGDGQDGYSRHDTPSLKRKLMELMEESPEEYRDLMSQLDG